MSDGRDASLSADAFARLDWICLEFEEACKAGPVPVLEQYLEDSDETERKRLFRELLHLELHYRGRHRQVLSQEEYIARFPEHREVVERVFSETPDVADTSAATDESVDDAAPASSIRPLRPTEELVIPKRIGRFRIERELGRGGFGVVLLAHDERLNRAVALKVPRSDVVTTPALQQRFHREALAAASLDHPNLVPVYDAGQFGPLVYIASAYCPGKTLAEWLKQGDEPVPGKAAANLVAEMADAVQHAHSRGVVHRDLKPGNVVLADDQRAATGGIGSPRITDFGLAKFLDATHSDERQGSDPRNDLTRSHAIIGTPCYMSPEQACGRTEGIGVATDIYGLGAILYELVTRRPPFQGESAWDVLDQVRSQEVLPPRQLRPGLPRDLGTIIERCLEKETRRRYASAADLAADLRRFVEEKPIVARPVGALERTWRWCRRKPAVAALSGSLAAVFLVSFASVTSLWLLADERRERAEHSESKANASARAALSSEQKAIDSAKHAQASYELARDALNECVGQVVNDPRLKRGSLEDLRRLVLTAQADFYEKFIQLQGSDPQFQAERGRTLLNLGDVRADLGEQSSALEHYNAARAIFHEMAHHHADHESSRNNLAAAILKAAHLQSASGNLNQSEQGYRQALAELETLSQAGPLAAKYQANRASLLVNLGNLYVVKVRNGPPEARDQAVASGAKAFAQAIQLLDELEQAGEPDWHTLGLAYANLGNLYLATRRLAEAERTQELAVATLKKVPHDHPLIDETRDSLASSLNSLGIIYGQTDRPERKKTMFAEALSIVARLAEDHPLIPRWRTSLGRMQNNYGMLLRNEGDLDASLPWFTDAIETHESVVQQDAQNQGARQSLMTSHQNCAEALWLLNRAAGALPHWDRALELDDGRYRVGYSLRRARTLALMGRHGEALSEAKRLAEESGARPDTLFYAACIVAAAVGTMSPDNPQRDSYCTRAIELIQQAVNQGFLDANRFHSDRDLDALRHRDDFQALLKQPSRKP